MTMDFKQKLDSAITKNTSLLCVGLDPDMSKLPKHLLDKPAPYFLFNKAIIDATADLVCAYKPNSAFYEARGAAGIEELNLTCKYILEKHPEIPIILDFKRADIGSTNDKYVEFAFDYLGVDAVTVHPYLGQEAIQSFLDRKAKGIIVMGRNSNPGAGEFQDLEINGRKLFLQVAENVATKWNANGNCLLVAGATFPEELAEIRSTVGDDFVLLVPGVGAQGGDVENTVSAGKNSKGRGMIISSSREIIYAGNGEDFAAKARERAMATRDEINKYL